MSFKDEVNRTKQFAEKNGTLINQVKDEIQKELHVACQVSFHYKIKTGEDIKRLFNS